jgi:hypothetical protein
MYNIGIPSHHISGCITDTQYPSTYYPTSDAPSQLCLTV